MPADRRRHPRPASAVPTAVNPDDELSIPISVAEIQQSDTMPPPLREQLARVVGRPQSAASEEDADG